MVHGYYWQEHRQVTEHRISQLTGEQTVPYVADRSNVSESERDGFSDKHPNLAQPHPFSAFGTSRGTSIEPAAAAGIGKRKATDRIWIERAQKSRRIAREGGSLAEF
jgi:hypothetical protein